MQKSNEVQFVSEGLRAQPIIVDAADLGLVNRPRMWWLRVNWKQVRKNPFTDQALRWGSLQKMPRLYMDFPWLESSDLELEGCRLPGRVEKHECRLPCMTTPAPTSEGRPPPKKMRFSTLTFYQFINILSIFYQQATLKPQIQPSFVWWSWPKATNSKSESNNPCSQGSALGFSDLESAQGVAIFSEIGLSWANQSVRLLVGKDQIVITKSLTNTTPCEPRGMHLVYSIMIILWVLFAYSQCKSKDFFFHPFCDSSWEAHT